MEVGELWVYQPTKFDSIHCGRVLNIGKKVEIKIQRPDWLKGKFKVERDQLHCLWDKRDAYKATVKPFLDLSSLPGPTEDEQNGAEIVLVATGLSDDVNFHVYGCAETYDAELVARACRIQIETLTGAPGTIVDGNYVAFPWETVLKLVKRLATTRRETILEYIRADVEFWDDRARNAATLPFSGLDAAEYDERRDALMAWFEPGYKTVRQWCGVRLSKQSDELANLRSDYRRLLELATSAAGRLPTSRLNSQLVDEIERYRHRATRAKG